MSTPYGNFRIGDAERMEAMDILGRALGEGFGQEDVSAVVKALHPAASIR